MKIQIICRGSVKHGLGHLFRTRTFFKEAIGKNEVQVIAIVEKELESVFWELRENTLFVRDEEKVVDLVKEYTPEVLIFDLTEITDFVFNEVKTFAKVTASISPVFNQINAIDILFTRTKFNNNYDNVITYGGLEYSIFNEYCTPINSITYKRNLKRPHLPIAISMGGTDSPNKTLKIIEALEDFPYEITLWVALGEGYAHSYTNLVRAINKNKKHEIILAKANKSTWDILGNSVLAILAGGLTTIEAVHAGLPSINIFEKKEHLEATSKELFEIGALINGHYFSEESIKQMKSKIMYLYKNRDELLKIRRKTKGAVDKNGSKRVLKILKNYLRSQ